MVAKALKRSMVYSNEASKQVIEGIIGDEVSINNTSYSFAMETHILTDIMTKNKLVNMWIQCLYHPDYCIGDIFSMIFEYNSAGVCFQSQHLPLFDIVNHLKFIDSMTHGVNREFDSSELPDILYCIDSLKGYCESRIRNEDPEKRRYQDALMCIESIMKDLNNEVVRHNDFYMVVITYWDQLKDSTHTFRTLAHYAVSQRFSKVTPTLRYELLNHLRNLAQNWPEEE